MQAGVTSITCAFTRPAAPGATDAPAASGSPAPRPQPRTDADTGADDATGPPGRPPSQEIPDHFPTHCETRQTGPRSERHNTHNGKIRSLMPRSSASWLVANIRQVACAPRQPTLSVTTPGCSRRARIRRSAPLSGSALTPSMPCRLGRSVRLFSTADTAARSLPWPDTAAPGGNTKIARCGTRDGAESAYEAGAATPARCLGSGA